MNISGRRVGPASCLLLVLALVSPTLAPGPLDAQVVRGHVLDDSTRLGVADVTVRAVAGTARVLRSVTTGASGEFLLDLPDSATVRLEGTRPGWSSVTSQPLHVPRGDTVTVEFWLSVRPIPVAPLYVTARSNLGRSRFRAHMEDWGKGIFFTPAMVDSIAPIHPVDLLRGQEDTWLTWRFG
ncbi:MAG TPA: carboxypeptidase-like regulatory domain-containing protein, partial [Longimicrobiales bacterium]|nr:carboxypeptidase-like regulatory domain-containing protein [Longimicrobiales bacterium]